jgi:hypothetical protein
MTTGPPKGELESLLLRRACVRSNGEGETVELNDDWELVLLGCSAGVGEEVCAAVTDGAKRTPRLLGKDGTRCSVLADGGW